jgi:hypothetical protein
VNFPNKANNKFKQENKSHGLKYVFYNFPLIIQDQHLINIFELTNKTEFEFHVTKEKKNP